MKKMIVACMALVLGFTAISLFNSGCGSSNSSTAPVTVTLQPTPSCAAEYGYPMNGIYSSSLTTGSFYAQPITIPAATKTLSMSIHLGGPDSGSIILCVYTDNGGAPATVVDQGTLSSLTANSWNTASLTGVNLTAGNYWIGWTSSGAVVVDSYINQTTEFSIAQTYGNTFPNYPTPPNSSYFNASGYAYGLVLDTICQ
jgi:hypothetical protein